MNCAEWDVFIAGSGPAGAAAALSLRTIAPGLRIAMADSGKNNTFHIGETIPPLIQPILEQLGLWTAFQAQNHAPTYSSLSAWGNPELESNEYLLQVHQQGWRLDRQRFDYWLAAEAGVRGVELLHTRVKSLNACNGGWQLDCGAAGLHRAKYVIDATGRNAFLTRQAGTKAKIYDRLVACAAFFSECENSKEPNAKATVVEAFQDGWWYTTSTPAGQRVVALMTDSDCLRQLGANNLEAWLDLLEQTRHIRPLVNTHQRLGPLNVWPASSCCVEDLPPEGLLAAGDAMSCFDPLSSQGILKAMRSGIFASYAIADSLLHGDKGKGCARYNRLMQSEFESYRRAQHHYYLQEQRWPKAAFWQRRHAMFPVSVADSPRLSATAN